MVGMGALECFVQTSLPQIMSATLSSLDALWFNVLSYFLLNNPLEIPELVSLALFIAGGILAIYYHPYTKELKTNALDTILENTRENPRPMAVFVGLIILALMTCIPIICYSLKTIKVTNKKRKKICNLQMLAFITFLKLK